MIKFGAEVQDKVTGFKGIVTGRCIYMYGCDQYLVTPKVGADNSWSDNKWIDEGRLNIIAAPVITEQDVQVKDPGGPSRGPQKN